MQLQRTLNPLTPVRLNGTRHVTHDQICKGWRTGGSRVRRGPGSGPRSERGPHQGQGDRHQPRRGHVARRRLIERVKFPAGLGYEAAGTVDAVGKDVGGFAVGDEVNVIPSFSLNDYSTYGEVILVPGHAVVRQTKQISFPEAASVWMMCVTAYGALIEDAKVTKGDFILVPAASSSVGLAAIQIANYAGATTIALTRTSTKKQQLLDAGAAHVIATQEVDLVGEVMRITNGQGARVVFDPVGGPTFPKLVSAGASGGIIYIYGPLSPGIPPRRVLKRTPKETPIKAQNIGPKRGNEPRRKAAIEF